jgi:hypothetical protein
LSSGNKTLYGFLLAILLLAGASIAAIYIIQNAYNQDSGPSVLIVGESADSVTLNEMLGMSVITRDGAYQNRLGNIGGNGTYQGVRVSDLVDLVGGMEGEDTIKVIASDGYNQSFAYSKVYPNASFLEIQGDMVLAFSYEGQTVPAYAEGFRLMFLPEDGLYSNADANATTEPDPPGAGPQCISNVVRIEVNSGGILGAVENGAQNALRTSFFFICPSEIANRKTF